MSLRLQLFSALLGMCLMAFLSSGCAVNPVSGDREVSFISAEKEQELGDQEAENVAKTMGLVDDPKILGYVQAIGGRLAKHSPRKDVSYTFYVVDMKEPNAFALPGGHVYVSRGLLVLVNSEDELAGVMGHEIGHVAGRHAVQRVTRAAATSPLTIATGIAGSAVGIVTPGLGDSIADAGQAASAAFIAPYSRDQEREADRVGQEMAANAGWNPEGLPNLLDTLGKADELISGEKHQSSFFDTHPATEERVAETRKHASQLKAMPAPPIAKDHAALMAKLDGLLIGDHPANGVFEDDEFFQPTMGFYMRYPSEWNKANTHDLVVAQDPDEKALVVLQVAGKGNDPVAVVKKIEKEQGGKLLENSTRLQINGLPAIQIAGKAKTRKGEIGVLFTWIAHQGVIYQITGMSPSDSFADYQKIFMESATSFRPLSDADWQNIHEARLRVVQARDGETLEELGMRVDSDWSPAEIAVVNEWPEATPLRQGQLIKVSILQPYRE